MVSLRDKLIFNTPIVITVGICMLLIAWQSPVKAEWIDIGSEQAVGEPRVTLLNETTDQLTIRWDISGFSMQSISTPQDAFRQIYFSLLDDPSSSEPGMPYLPLLTEIIRVPSGMKAAIKVLDVEWINVGSYHLYPRQSPHRATDPPSEFAYSEIAYSSNEPFPAGIATIGNVQGWGGVPITSVGVTPFRYVPATGELQAARSVTVQVDFLPGGRDVVEGPNDRNISFDRLYQNVLLNPPPLESLDADENEPIRMLFIMREQAEEVVQPLLDFHFRTGLNPDVWIIDDDVDEQDIQDRIAEDYEDGLSYVFLIGDHPEVPMYYWNPWDDPGLPAPPDDSHSDSWYVCLDDPDENRYEDHLPELAIGRLAFDEDEIESLEVQVSKLINYLEWTFEDPDDWDWLETSILLGHREDDNELGTHYIACKEEIADRDYALPHPEFVEFYGNDREVRNSTVIDFINEEGTGLFNYRGHGSEWIWSRWNSWGESWGRNNVRQLENINNPFVLISSACLNADITQINDCLLDVFQQLDRGGSVCAHGSVVSTFTRGNHYFDKAIFRAFFDDGVFALGDAQMQAVTEMVGVFDQDDYPIIGRLNTRAYIWLGDPALELRDAQPMELSVEFFPVVQPGDEVITARIFGNEDPLPGARLCVRLDDPEIYMVGETNEEGRVTFELDVEIGEDWVFDWTAYHRNAIPNDDVLWVVEGAGAVEGTVMRLSDSEPIEDAVVTIQPFNYDAVTDVEGYYRFDGVPSLDVILSTTVKGYFPIEVEAQVRDAEVIRVDLELLHAMIEMDSLIVTQHLLTSDSIRRELEIRNTGTGELIWDSEIIMQGDNAPYSEYALFPAYIEVSDNRLQGVEFINDHYYVAGSNRLGDPNKIYVLNRDGESVRTYDQPNEAAGLGIRDLAWDGQFLYGSSGGTIFRLTLDGELDGTFNGPYSPCKAMTCDSEGNFWVGKDTEDLILIDEEGTELDRLDHDLFITALAWHPEQSDGYNLFIFVRGEDTSTELYMANLETGDIVFVADLTGEEGDTAGYGLSLTSDLEAGRWHLVGMVENDQERWLNVWNVELYTDWIDYEPVSGIIPPHEEIDLTINFNTQSYNNVRLEADVVFHTNGFVPEATVTVALEIGVVSVEEGTLKELPESFNIGSAYPNPFNHRTIVPISLPNAGRMQANLYDLQGRLVEVVTNDYYQAGNQNLSINAESLSTGVYLLHVKTLGAERVQKIILMR